MTEAWTKWTKAKGAGVLLEMTLKRQALEMDGETPSTQN